MIYDLILTSRFFTPKWIFVIFSSLIILLPIILAIKYRKYLSDSLRIISIYLYGSLFLEILCWAIILLPFLNHRNHWVLNILNIFEFICLSYYFLLITKGVKIKNVIKAVSILSFLIIIISITVNFKEFNKYDDFAHSIVYITLILFVLLNFYEMLYSDEILLLSNYSYFWIASGILIYFSGAFFVTLFGDKILLLKGPLKDYWIIYHILLIIFRVFIAIGLWFSKTPQQLSSSLK